jgi:hypothetical protein
MMSGSGSLALPTQLDPVAALGQSINFFNTILAQAAVNPFALLALPISIPNALASQLAPKMQSGALQSKSTNVSVPASGALVRLQPLGTLINAGQVVVTGPSPALITTDPNGGSGTTVPVGGTFNFGSIDIGAIYLGSGAAPGATSVTLYTEQ